MAAPAQKMLEHRTCNQQVTSSTPSHALPG